MARFGISKAEVLAAAKAECEARDWPWRQPVRVIGWPFGYRVWTNANVIDDNPWFLISRDGPVKDAAWARRPAGAAQ
jgi:hypothetical protein